MIVCTSADVMPWPCVCKKYHGEHEWNPVPEYVNAPGLFWCDNCDCCVMRLEEA